VLWRPARAHWHRAGARRQAGIHRLRRIDRRTGRVDPGAGAEPVHGFARGAESDLPFHQPRSGRRAAYQRSRRDHVPRANRRIGSDAAGIQRAQPPVHPGAAARNRGSRAEEADLRPDSRRNTLADGAAVGLSFPSALPVCDADMPRRGAAAGRDRAGAMVGLPSQRRGAALTPAVRRHGEAGPSIPLVLDSPHSGTAYPADFDHAAPRALVRRAEDTYVEELFASAPRMGATLIEALFPRAYIDPNRHVADIDTALLADAWPGPVTPSRKTEQGIGLVWRLAHGGVPMYARRLGAAEVQRRIERYYDPYHAAVAAALDERHRAFGAVWHLNCHSMPAEGDVNSDDPGRARADFVLGDRDATTCAPEFTDFVAATLAAMGYEVAINDPYKGVELVRKFGRPHERRHSLQIEINRRLYMNETTLAKLDGFEPLRRNLDRLLDALRTFVLARVA